MIRGLVTIAVLSVGFLPGMWSRAMAGEARRQRLIGILLRKQTGHYSRLARNHALSERNRMS